MPVFAKFPPKGSPLVTVYDILTGGKTRYQLLWYVDGKAQRKTITDEKKALDHAKLVAQGLKKGSNRDVLVSRQDYALLQKAKKLGEEELDKALQRKYSAGGMTTVSDVSDRFLQIYDYRKKSTRQTVTQKMSQIVEAFGDRSLTSLTVEELQEWYHGLPGAARNKNNILSVFVTFLNECKAWELLPADRLSVAERVRRIRTTRTDPGIVTIDQAKKILKGIEPNILAYMSLGFFAGLRPSEAAGVVGERDGLKWDDIDFDKKTIRIRREVAGKLGKPRLVEPPEVVFEWLNLARAVNDNKAVCFRKSYEIWSNQNQENDYCLPWPADAARHSFVSYYLAMTGNIMLTAKQAGNSPQIIESNYHNPRSKAEGEEWFSLTPKKVGRIS